MMEKDKESTFYSDDRGVRITNARAVMPDGTTYSMANITSVRTGVEHANRKPGLVVGMLGLLVLGICAGLESTGGIIVGVVVLGIGIAIAMMAKATYSVQIATAAGEKQLVTSKDNEYIKKVVGAMNEAFVKRG